MIMSESVGQDFLRAFPGVRCFRVAKIQKMFEMTKYLRLNNVKSEKKVMHLFHNCTRIYYAYIRGSLKREPRDVFALLFIVEQLCLTVLLNLVYSGELAREDVVDRAFARNVLYLTA